jgi:hypothetical protein
MIFLPIVEREPRCPRRGVTVNDFARGDPHLWLEDELRKGLCPFPKRPKPFQHAVTSRVCLLLAFGAQVTV